MSCRVVVHCTEYGLSVMHCHWNATPDIYCKTRNSTRQCKATGDITHNVYCDILWCRCTSVTPLHSCVRLLRITLSCTTMVMCRIERRIVLSVVISYVALSVSKLSKCIKHNITSYLPNILSVEYLL